MDRGGGKAGGGGDAAVGAAILAQSAGVIAGSAGAGVRRPGTGWGLAGGAGVLVLMSVRCLGLVVGRIGVDRAGPAGGVQGPGDLGVVESGVAGGGGQRAQVGGRVGFQGAVGGPEQARVAVAFLLAGDPAGQMAQGLVRGQPGLEALLLPTGLQQLGDGVPVEVAAALVVLRSW